MKIEHRTREVSIAIVLWISLSAGLSACLGSVDPGGSYWALNDSDRQIVIVAHEAANESWLLPPHSFIPLFDTRGVPPPGWTISIADDACAVVTSWPIDANHNLFYVGPSGATDLRSGLAWQAGLKTAKDLTSAARTPPCP